MTALQAPPAELDTRGKLRQNSHPVWAKMMAKLIRRGISIILISCGGWRRIGEIQTSLYPIGLLE